MQIQKYAKKDIARAQIETALRLFSEDGELFSIITLAGAAEEIVGQLLRGKAGKSGPGAKIQSVWEMLRPGGSKADGKAGRAGDESDDFVHMDARQEALFLLGRAIDDYHALTGTLSAGMLSFKQQAPK